MKLYCEECQAVYDLSLPRWRCDCGNPLEIEYQPVFDKTEIKKSSPSLWRYRSALPLMHLTEPPRHLGEGFTPLIGIDGQWGNAENNLFKLDFMMPTGSYKDRGAAVMMQQLKAWGISELLEDSSGNAGAAVAAYSSLAGIKAKIFIPASASAGKAAQIELYGAELVRVPGTRENTTEAAEAAAQRIFYASHNWSPWFVHGVKTLALELWEQLAWVAPKVVIAPVGNGSIILGLYQGFKELLTAGEIETLPRIYGVQTEACDPLVQAYRAGSFEPLTITKSSTMAEGIASAKPVKGRSILKAIRESKGSLISVSENEIWHGLRSLAKQGVYIEPTSGTAVAGLLKLRSYGEIGTQELAIVELTGSGLKATDKLVDLMREYHN